MSAFPTDWNLYVEKAGIPIAATAVFKTGDTDESGTVTATGPTGATYSGTWSETPSPQGNQITFSLTPNGSSTTLQFVGFRVLYAMGGQVMLGSQPVAGWSACAPPPNTAQQELEF
jgi:hypothetical protein